MFLCTLATFEWKYKKNEFITAAEIRHNIGSMKTKGSEWKTLLNCHRPKTMFPVVKKYR